MPVLLFNFAESWFFSKKIYEFLFLMQSYGVKIKKTLHYFTIMLH